ncbi:MAG TPA: hypothetical protein PLZ12_15600 [Saprospiraceae bacterium]|nr:hypothetical protein [Saprospiraceae bacterium]
MTKTMNGGSLRVRGPRVVTTQEERPRHPTAHWMEGVAGTPLSLASSLHIQNVTIQCLFQKAMTTQGVVRVASLISQNEI